MDKLTGRKKKKIYRAKCCACGALNQRLLLEDSNGLFECDSCGAINAAIRKYWDLPQELPSSDTFMVADSVVLSRLVVNEELRRIR